MVKARTTTNQLLSFSRQFKMSNPGYQALTLAFTQLSLLLLYEVQFLWRQ